jgi:hypothetical protein
MKMLARWSATASLTLLFAFALPAAATTYQYTGPFYVAPVGSFTTSMRITGSFTTASPLPANMPSTAIGPAGDGRAIAWSFSNGVTTFTQSNSMELYGDSTYFSVSTDSLGNIATFTIGLMAPLPPHAVATPMQFVFMLSSGSTQAANNTPCDGINGANVCTAFSLGGDGYVADETVGSFAPNVLPVLAAPVPVASPWTLTLLALLLCVSAGWAVRRANPVCLRQPDSSRH